MAKTKTKFLDKKLRAFLKKIDKKITKFEQDGTFGRFVSPIVYQDIIEHFENESGPVSHWDDWSDSYTDFMYSIGKGGNQILQDTGRLRNNFKLTSFESRNGSIVWFNNAKTKNGFPYAYAHNEGGSVLPKREFMWLSKKAMSKIGSASIDWIFKGL